MDPEDAYDEYEDDDDLAKEFGKKPGIVARAKAVAKRKASAAKEAAKGERDYQAYKHRDAAEIAGVEYDHSKAPEYAKRKEREDAEALVRKAQRKAKLSQYKTTAKQKMRSGIANISRKMKEQPKGKAAPGLFDFGGGGGGGMLSDPMGFGSGKAPSFDLGIGGGKGRSFDLGIGGGFSFGSKKRGKKRKRKEFSLF